MNMRHEKGQLVFSSSGVIKLTAMLVYEHPERAGRSMEFLNTAFRLANERGYEEEADFRKYFMGREDDTDKLDDMIDNLLSFVEVFEIWDAMGVKVKPYGKA